MFGEKLAGWIGGKRALVVGTLRIVQQNHPGWLQKASCFQQASSSLPPVNEHKVESARKRAGVANVGGHVCVPLPQSGIPDIKQNQLDAAVTASRPLNVSIPTGVVFQAQPAIGNTSLPQKACKVQRAASAAPFKDFQRF
jgi:hypothetical protein